MNHISQQLPSHISSNRLKSTLIAAAVCASLAANAYLGFRIWADDSEATTDAGVVDEPIIMRTPGGVLEVSTITATESFQRTTPHTILGVHVGTTIAQIRVPAVYRYHIKLARDWEVLLRNKTFIVIAPAIEPSLPVAIKTGQLQAQSFGVWSPVTGPDLIQALQKSITQELAKRAGTPNYIQLQRNAARQTVTEFVQKWLVTQEQWKRVSGHKIQVFFADEPIQGLESVLLQR